MHTRAFTQALTSGALVLGVATALSACDPSNTTAAGGGSSGTQSAQSAATQATARSANSTQAAGGAATGSGGSGGSGAGSGGGSNACPTGRVSVKLGSEDAGLGHRGLILLFTNTGSTGCTVAGYPGATVTDNGQTDFAPLMDAKRTLTGYEGGTRSVTTVTLAPGASASAVLEWLAAPADGDDPAAANCPGMAGGYLEITPPNTTAATKFQPPADMCSDLQVHPVVAGSSGRSGS